MVRPFSFACVAMLLASATSAQGVAAPHSLERILPATTKAMVAIDDVGKLTDQFNATGLGRLVHDPVLDPFLQEVKKKLQAKMLETGVELGVQLEDLRGVVTGPAGVAAIQPGNQSQQAAIVLMAYVAGQEEKARELIERGLNKLEQRDARRSSALVGHATLNMVEFPVQGVMQRACYVLHDGWLIVTDHRGTMGDLLARLQKDDGKGLASVASYQACMKRCQVQPGEGIRWFVDPFAYVQVTRAIATRHGACGKGDIAEVLANQGFDAVQALGGMIWVGEGPAEITHRTFVYAPGEAAGQRFRMAARMLDFPNSENLQTPLAWLPGNLAMQATFNVNIQGAFESVGSLVNALAKDEVFEDVLESIENDPNGPQVDIRNELVANLGRRVSMMSDFTLPISPTSERALFAVELTRPAPVAQAVNRAMAADPSVKKTQVGEHVVWEIVNDTPEAELVALEVETDGFGFGEEGFGEAPEEPGQAMPNFAVTVTDQHLLIATQASLIADVLNHRSAINELAAAEDFRRIGEHLEGLAPGAGSLQLFLRPDSALMPSYELLRANQMPESKSPLAMLINMVQGGQEGVPRKQQLDGSTLPPFAEVAKYLGPAGMKLKTESNGWFLSGCVLPRTP